MYERVLGKLALITGQRIGAGGVEHATFRELVNGLDEQEKPCFVIMPMKCTGKTNTDAETSMLDALRPPLDETRHGDSGELYAVWASKAVVDTFMIKIREKVETGAW